MSEAEKLVGNNSEILFLYEAKNTNPNGDPDDENRPRMDYKTGINYVTDVRLKRYFRDYLTLRYGEKYVWVTKINNQHVDATKRLELLQGKDVIAQCIDARLFGATIPIKGRGKEKGKSESYIGPVQFSWGFSLHKVELMDTQTITSVFTGRTGEEEQEGEETRMYGNIGKDYRVYYSLIAFYGAVSGERSKVLKLTEYDLKILDNFLWDALLNETITRSKIGQRPIAYLRIEYKNSSFLLGDLRRFLDVKFNDPVRTEKDIEVNYSRFINEIKTNKDLIKSVYIRGLSSGLFGDDLSNLVKVLPHNINDDQIKKYLEKRETG
ncbi:type I-B CRISPR-associated protein Cas7/Csh2 [Candidatus Marsarchaeota G1 archaeon BE_D]|jgi:CRISPR-associated protein, Csh2 family|uniref:Type I-B CRISPR-associated protein Cas7/Csh2 n=1 Tax=Candidatus Marsarchaeota G1 archaeon BE_D TaxID=1978156 RepID=A0A2R6A8I6_9ARCH|nr:MAG: type I-B CRISPR-associated protein Cas7/Csh2 [Candidatus Marsarchaeota G1 archaeon BE_D]